MKAVKVQYKVQEDYVEQNKSNIRAVMDALKKKSYRRNALFHLHAGR